MPTTSNCLNPGKGLTVTARARLFPVPSVLLLGCHPLGSQFKTGLPGLPFLGRPRIPVFVTLSLRGFQTLQFLSLSATFSMICRHFPHCNSPFAALLNQDSLNITLSNSAISLLSPTPIYASFRMGSCLLVSSTDPNRH